MKLHAPDLSANRGPQAGKDGFHTVPNQALFAAHSNRSRRGNEADSGHPFTKESASSRRRLRDDAPLGLHPRTRWNASLPVIVLALLFAWNSFAADVELRITHAGFDASGAALLEVTGPAPGVYQLESSDDLKRWQPVAKEVLIRGALRFTDPQAAAHPQRYYRAVLTGEPPYQPGVVLLRFKAEANVSSMNAILADTQIERVDELLTPAMEASGCPAILCAHTSLSVPEAVALLNDNPGVEFAEPNYVVTRSAASNDPKFTDGSLWGMYGDTTSPANAFGSQAAEAWRDGYTGSRQVYVGVIDEGIQFEHPDLAANIWTNPFDPPNGRDDDGNGYVDDMNGWDFYQNNNSVFDGSPTSPNIDAHGTHVAGTIGGVGGNGLDVAGVNWQVTMISGKFLGPDGGYIDDAIKAVDYFTDLKRRHGLNIVALNNSWGGGGYARGLHEAILRAAKANILFIAAAGNSANNNDARAYYPSCYITTQGTPGEEGASFDAVISVAAIARDGATAWFTSYGAQTVDLGAPGVGVVSSVPWMTYASYNGTSMATPHVTGAAALYASTHPGATAAEIRAALLGSTIPTPALAGKCVTGGRLNLSTVIRPAPPVTPPTAPTSLDATFSSDFNVVFLSWFDNSTVEDGFRVERSINGGGFVSIATLTRNAAYFADDTFPWSANVSYRIVAFRSNTASAPSNVDSVATPAQPRFIYVDATYHGGTPDGSPGRPFPTLTRAHAAAADGNIVRIRANTYRERPLLTKRIKVEPIGGAVQIIP